MEEKDDDLVFLGTIIHPPPEIKRLKKGAASSWQLAALTDTELQSYTAACKAITTNAVAEATRRTLAKAPAVRIIRGTHVGKIGRLVKRTKKGGHVLLPGGGTAWIQATAFSQTTNWTTLPETVLIVVFSQLSQPEVAALCRVCTHWNAVARSAVLWRDWDFNQITSERLTVALSTRRGQRRFILYGEWMRARGARIRSLRLFTCSVTWSRATDFSTLVNIGFPPLDTIDAARPLSWHLNSLLNGVDCTRLQKVFFGNIDQIGALTSMPVFSAAAATIASLTFRFRVRRPEFFQPPGALLTNLRVLRITSALCGGFGPELNVLLQASPVLVELHLDECHVQPSAAVHPKTPYSLSSASVEIFSLSGKGFHQLIGLDMPQLRKFSDAENMWSWPQMSWPGNGEGRCEFDFWTQFKYLETVHHHRRFLGGVCFTFPATRGMNLASAPAEESRYLCMCECEICVAAQ